jgi:hypothetical protein
MIKLGVGISKASLRMQRKLPAALLNVPRLQGLHSVAPVAINTDHDVCHDPDPLGIPRRHPLILYT